MKKKSIIILGLLLVSLLGSSFTQNSAAWISLWSVGNGDYRIYQLLREQRNLNNQLIDIMEESFLQYTILNESDFIADGYSDLALLVTDYSTVPETVTETFIMDLTWFLEAQQAAAVVFNQLHDSDLLESIRSGPIGVGSSLVLPTNCVSTFMVIFWFYYGLNWTAALNAVNTTLTGYTAYNQTPYVHIEYNATNQYDAALFANYTETGTIIWNMKTGWLESLEYNRVYDAPLSFSVVTEINSYFQSITSSGGGIISLKDIFAWLGLAVGVASLCFVIYVVKRKERTYNWVE